MSNGKYVGSQRKQTLRRIPSYQILEGDPREYVQVIHQRLAALR